MQLDIEEQRIIEKHRLDKAVAEEKLSAGHLIVSIAAQWAEYSKHTGYGLTYSEFCDGFAFDTRVDEKYHPFRKHIFDGVKRMYSVVDDISSDLGQSVAAK